MSALSVAARSGDQAPVRPVAWRRMIWVTWRQHRFALAGVGALLVALAVWLWIDGVGLHHAYAAARACHPAGSAACGLAIQQFDTMDGFLASGWVLHLVPALIGAFVGAPLLARELETGTFRFAWTQGFGRWRWTLAKLVLLAVVVAVAAGAISLLFDWYYQPYFQPYLTAGSTYSLTTQSSPLASGLFDLRGIAVAGWTLAAFAIGAFAGTLTRRVVPAIAATLAAYAGLLLFAVLYLRHHYLAPLVTSSLNLPGSAWIISQQWHSAAGQPVSQSALGQLLRQGAPQLAGKGGVPNSLGTWQYLARHGYTQWTTYQPAGRFWAFQSIEGGWLLALSAVLIAATVWIVRRRAS